MALTVEQLTKPRFRVIADYPLGVHALGELLMPLSGTYMSVVEGGFYLINLTHYPHLFKALDWWEERNPEDMPEYLKTFAGNSVRKIEQIVFDKVMFVGGSVKNIKHWLPATKEEFESFTQKITHDN